MLQVNVYVHLATFFESYKFFFNFIYPFSISVIFFPFPYFNQKLFYFLCIQLLICLCAYLYQLIGRIIFRYFGISYFVWIAWHFCINFKVSFLMLISFSSVISLICVCIFRIFSFRWILVCFIFLSCFTCGRSFSICRLIFIFHPGFVFLFRFLWEMPFFLSPTCFAPAKINSFISIIIIIIIIKVAK